MKQLTTLWLKGVDVIVTDHHELPEQLQKPMRLSTLDIRKETILWNLAGVGVAFKVATALLGELPIELWNLVAIGTIADLISLTDENRTFVKMG